MQSAPLLGLHHFITEIKSGISDFLESLKDHPAFEPLNYFFAYPGKMLRPTLVYLSYQLLTSSEKTATPKNLLPLALGLEFLHSASLIHDDILDQTQLRRAQTSLHLKFSPKMALLTGDLLYTQALELLQEILPRPQLQQLLKTTSKMCLAEIEALEPLPNQESYFKNIREKTAGLFQVACELSAFLCDASEEQSCALSNFGLEFGTFYQLVDDYQDQDNPWINQIDFPATLQKKINLIQKSLKPFPSSYLNKFILEMIDNIGKNLKLKPQ